MFFNVIQHNNSLFRPGVILHKIILDGNSLAHLLAMFNVYCPNVKQRVCLASCLSDSLIFLLEVTVYGVDLDPVSTGSGWQNCMVGVHFG